MQVPENVITGDYLVAETAGDNITGFRVKGTRDACLNYMRTTRWPSKKSGRTLDLLVVVNKSLSGKQLERLALRYSSWVL